MKKTFKLILISIAAIVLTAMLLIVAVGVGITGFVAYVWGGMRLTPEAAIEAVGINMSQLEYVETEDLRVYYRTADDSLGYMVSEFPDDYMYEIYPVQRQDVLWYANTRPLSYACAGSDEGKTQGVMYSFEAGGKYHNFFIPDYKWNDKTLTYSLPDSLSDGYDKVTVNNTEIKLFKRAYFVTDADVTEFEIGDLTFTVNK